VSKQFHGAVDVWKRNFNHVEHLFDYGSAVRKVMCTTNAVESINSSFRKVTKKGAFQMKCTTQIALLRTTELYKSGMAVRFKIGLWSEINWLRMKKSVTVLKNTST
jgi:putative transposase